MGAALAAHEAGSSTVIIERNEHLGGILRQCIHPGFGLTHFKEELTGPEYAQRFIDKVSESGIETMLGSMALAIDGGKGDERRAGGDAGIPADDACAEREAPAADGHTVTVMTESGMVEISCRSVVLAMGCRERTRSEIKIPGSRPAGVFTAGLAQRYINIENLRPGHRVVILGSGDILSLIHIWTCGHTFQQGCTTAKLVIIVQYCIPTAADTHELTTRGMRAHANDTGGCLLYTSRCV